MTILESGREAGEVPGYFWPLSKVPRCTNAHFYTLLSILIHAYVLHMYKMNILCVQTEFLNIR